MNKELSTVAALHLSEDYFQTSLRPEALLFYTIHITVLNFLQRVCREHTSRSRRKPYLPVDHEAHGVHGLSRKVNYGQNNWGHFGKLRKLLESVENVLESFGSSSFLGFSAIYGNYYQLSVHSILESHVAAKSVAEDTLSVKRANVTKLSAYNYQAVKADASLMLHANNGVYFNQLNCCYLSFLTYLGENHWLNPRWLP